jgi:hypothetical protein
MKIVQVFKTDVPGRETARVITSLLKRDFSQCRINFDLDDCDRILRIESRQTSVDEMEILLLVGLCGYHCEPLQE